MPIVLDKSILDYRVHITSFDIFGYLKLIIGYFKIINHFVTHILDMLGLADNKYLEILIFLFIPRQCVTVL